MMCTVALTIGALLVYLMAVLLCCRVGGEQQYSVPAPHEGRHARRRRGIEAQLTDRFLDAWMRGKEQVVKELWVVKEWPVWSWNCG